MTSIIFLAGRCGRCGTHAEWADYREMHALLLLFGTPIFVFDEHLQLLQAFEPDPEKKRLPNREGESLTPFRLMWHGKLGHYTSVSLLEMHFFGSDVNIVERHPIRFVGPNENAGDNLLWSIEVAMRPRLCRRT